MTPIFQNLRFITFLHYNFQKPVGVRAPTAPMNTGTLLKRNGFKVMSKVENPEFTSQKSDYLNKWVTNHTGEEAYVKKDPDDPYF